MFLEGLELIHKTTWINFFRLLSQHPKSQAQSLNDGSVPLFFLARNSFGSLMSGGHLGVIYEYSTKVSFNKYTIVDDKQTD